MSGPLVLAVNAAEARLQLALGRIDDQDVTFLAAQEWHAPSQGAEILAPSLAAMLERLGLSVRDIGRIACVNGPGSFTGLRLALVTAAGLARTVGAVQAGLPYLSLLAGIAANCLAPCSSDTPGILWVVTHARRNSVHVQGFDPARGCASLGDPAVLAIERVPGHPLANGPTLAEFVRSESGRHPIRLLGSGAHRNREAIQRDLPEARFLAPAFNHPSVDGLLRAAQSAHYADADIDPLYIRPSDAEENLERIAANLGLDGSEARQRLDALTSSFCPEND